MEPVPRPPKKVILSKKILGERLRAIREQRGYSQGGLARLLGSHPQSISQIERGIRGLTIQQVVKLARVFQVPTDEILGDSTHAVTPLNGDRQLLRRFQRVQQLPLTQRKSILKLLDSALGMTKAESKVS
jgi:transcriptional regulator with XRE-family HTH domain